MRISDWSSDVCSSDLTLVCCAGLVRRAEDLPSVVCDPRYLNPQTGPFYVEGARPGDTLAVHFASIEPRHDWGVSSTVPFFGALTASRRTRSEEHTSELQSLMRISYAVFCLKKKKMKE